MASAVRGPRWELAGAAASAVLVAALAAPVGVSLWNVWQSDSALSHGPLIQLIAAGLLWARRAELKAAWTGKGAPALGLLAVLLMSLLHAAATWADVAFLQGMSLIGLAAAVVWTVAGTGVAKAAIGALGFLAFMVPWPTTLTERLAFPLQMTSTAYAALFGGLMGIPIQREGVQLAIVPTLGEPPIYTMLVAAKCSGLTSLMVLLALGYLITSFTPAHLGWRALLLLSVVPLTLLANTLRLTLILLAAAHGSPSLAQWVHDHEAPVLIFFCSIGLIGMQRLLLWWLQSRSEAPPEVVREQIPVISA